MNTQQPADKTTEIPK